MVSRKEEKYEINRAKQAFVALAILPAMAAVAGAHDHVWKAGDEEMRAVRVTDIDVTANRVPSLYRYRPAAYNTHSRRQRSQLAWFFI
jgi:hypothetical protein